MGHALGDLSPDVSVWATWLARTWWGPGLAPALWLGLSLALAVDEGPDTLRPITRRLFWPVLGGSLAIGLFFGVGGSLTELVHRWSAASALDPPWRFGSGPVRDVPDGPLYGGYRLYAVVCLALATGILALLWRASEPRTPLRSRFGWLLVSAILFIVGVAELTVASSFSAVPELPGHLLLLVGILIMGWNLARYGALMAGEVVAGDFVAFVISMLAVLGVYGSLFLFLTPRDFSWVERTVPLLLVVMATHVVTDSPSHLLDRLIYGRMRSTLRGRLRRLAGRIGRQPDPMTALVDAREIIDSTPLWPTPGVADTGAPLELRLLVEGALRHLNDLPAAGCTIWSSEGSSFRAPRRSRSSATKCVPRSSVLTTVLHRWLKHRSAKTFKRGCSA